jgi:hypothetical protein
LNGKEVEFAYSNNNLMLTIPADGGSGMISVSNPAGSAVSEKAFVVGGDANLAVRITGTSDPVEVGEEVPLFVAAANYGPLSISQGQLQINIPPGWEVISFSLEELECHPNESGLGCEIGELNPGEIFGFFLNLKALEKGQFALEAMVSSEIVDLDQSDNSFTFMVEVTGEIIVPVISSFSPENGAAGVSVTLSGENFFGIFEVKFNGVTAEFTLNSSSELVAVVPEGASSGLIEITGPSGSAVSAEEFVVETGAVDPPLLLVLSASNNRVELQWAASGGPFVLEQTETLQAPIQWQPVPGLEPVTVEGTTSVFVERSGSTRFFRLAPAGGGE